MDALTRPGLLAAGVLLWGAVACGGGDGDAGDDGRTEVAEADEGAGAAEDDAGVEVRDLVGVEVDEGVRYGSAEVAVPAAGPAPLLMDVYRPADGEGPFPVVVLVHGGGFVSQSRTDAGIVRIARGLAAEGIVAASIDYRLLGQEPVPSGRVAPLVEALPDGRIWTAMATAVDDTLTALDHLVAHAGELGIDPDRIGVVGSSAGAITADHVGYTLDDHGIARPPVAFVGSLFGGVFVPPPEGEGTKGAEQLGPGDPPLFAVHGDADDRVPVVLDDELVERAEGSGVEHEYHRIPGGGHGYEPSGFFTHELGDGSTPYERLLAFATDHLAT